MTQSQGLDAETIFSERMQPLLNCLSFLFAGHFGKYKAELGELVSNRQVYVVGLSYSKVFHANECDKATAIVGGSPLAVFIFARFTYARTQVVLVAR